MASFHGWGSPFSRLKSHYEKAVHFLPVVLNLGPFDYESSTLTTRPLYVNIAKFIVIYLYLYSNI